MTVKRSWKHKIWHIEDLCVNDTIYRMFCEKNIHGLLSGESVWIITQNEDYKIFDSLGIGMVDGGREMTDILLELLHPSTNYTCVDRSAHKKSNSRSFSSSNCRKSSLRETSASKNRVVRAGAEEAFFLVHAVKCLTVYKNLNETDAWVQLESGSFETLHSMSSNQLLNEFSTTCPQFLYRYLVYFHYKAKGWLIRSGLQFGANFVLYKYHPKTIHSEFAVIVFPTTAESTNKPFNMAFSRSKTRFINRKIFESPTMIDHRLLWTEISGLKRVQNQVNKRLIISYIAIIDKLGKVCKHDSIDDNEKLYSTISKKTASQSNYSHSTISTIIDRAYIQEIIVGRWNPGKI